MTKKEKFPEYYKQWIVENLIEEVDRDGILDKLVELGFDRKVANSEINKAEKHPYTKAARPLFYRYKRREWMMKVVDYVQRLDPDFYKIPEFITPPDYQTFLKDYFTKNRPVVFRGVAKDWPIMQYSMDKLQKDHGHVNIKAMYGRNEVKNYEEYGASRFEQEKTLSEFIEDIKARSPTNDFYLTSRNRSFNNEEIFFLYQAVGDIADGYFDQEDKVDANDIWFGPEGTISALHMDHTNNLIVQVFGKKRVILVPSLQVPYVYNEEHVFSKMDLTDLSYEKHRQAKNITFMEVVLEPGDAVFLPVGWWHFVQSLSISMSLTLVNFKDVTNKFFDIFPYEDN